jgi:hypothetical protein
MCSTLVRRECRGAVRPAPGVAGNGGADVAKRTCSVEGCENPHLARGWCSMHYQRWTKTGSLDERPPNLCEVEDCERRVHGHGLCHPHWRRWRKHDDPGGPIRDVTLSREERFWAKVDRDGPVPESRPDLGPCWIWLAGKTKGGYGHFNGGAGRSGEAHRFAYEEVIGSIPVGLVLDHLCRVPPCVNPAHLEAVTVLENLERGLPSPSRINRERKHCRLGHPFDAENTLRERSGKRRCRICRQDYERRQRRAS